MQEPQRTQQVHTNPREHAQTQVLKTLDYPNTFDPSSIQAIRMTEYSGNMFSMGR